MDKMVVEADCIPGGIDGEALGSDGSDGSDGPGERFFSGIWIGRTPQKDAEQWFDSNIVRELIGIEDVRNLFGGVLRLRSDANHQDGIDQAFYSRMLQWPDQQTRVKMSAGCLACGFLV